MDASELLRTILVLLGGGALGAIVVKMLNRGVDNATAQNLTSQSNANDVKVLRDIITEVRAADAAKNERLNQLERRMALLEERERHMLTRAAVHEAWDQLAFAALLVMNPDHPPPPPLVLEGEHDD